MRKANTMNQMRARVTSAAPGAVFIPSDFADLAEPRTVSIYLSRMLTVGTLEKVKRGIYAKPRRSDWLSTAVPPKSDEIAKAIARNFGWTIVPCGDAALNMLGLSTQIPAVWLYVSDGSYKIYEADEITLQFKHTDRKNELIGISYQSALVIQALRALGKEQIGFDTIQKLRGKLTAQERERMLRECRHITAWIFEIIKLIAENEKQLLANKNGFRFRRKYGILQLASEKAWAN